MEQGSREKLLELLQTFENAMLVTAAKDGSLRSRPMAVFQVERTDGTLWFMTSATSGKVDEIAADSHVNVALQKAREFVSVSGRARVVRDRSKIDELWSEHAKVYFPKGKDDPDLALIRVAVDEAEYWDSAGVQGIKYLFEAVKAYVTGTTPEVGADQHGSVKLQEPGRAGNGTGAPRAAR